MSVVAVSSALMSSRPSVSIILVVELKCPLRLHSISVLAPPVAVTCAVYCCQCPLGIDAHEGDMQYFSRNSVNAHFQQGNISKGGEFCELKPYLIAKLMWNPDADFQAIMTDFLEGYYEEAAPYIAKYIHLMHDELEKSGLKLTIYGNPADHAEKGFLRPELMEQYEKFFDEAEKAVIAKPDVLERVQTARLPLAFSLFEIAKRKGAEEAKVFDKANGKIHVRPETLEKLEKFRQLCNKTGVKYMVEGGLTPDEYCERTKSVMINVTNQ